MNVNEYIVNAIKKEGIKHVFSIPGNLVDSLFAEFGREKNIEVIVPAHEAGAAFMAYGYARSTGKFGVCVCLGGPGITNTVTAIATAKTDQCPVLVISGDVGTGQQGKGIFQDGTAGGTNTASIFQSITSAQAEIKNPSAISYELEQLLKTMLNPTTKGPVYMSVPMDMQRQEVNFEFQKLPENFYHPKFLDTKAVDNIWEHLYGSKKIAILAGFGAVISKAENEILKFAEKYQIPVAATFGGKGIIPENHSLSLGLFGWTGHRYAFEVLLSDELDTLIISGARLNMFDTMMWTKKLCPSKNIILNDISSSTVYSSLHIDYNIIGDSKTFFERLNNYQGKKQECLLETANERKNWIKEIKSYGSMFYDEENMYSDSNPIQPARLIRDLRKYLPQDTVMYSDSGAHTLFSVHYWTVTHPSQYITDVRYMGPMGGGIPAGIGSHFANPGRPHVVVTGDGCMLMHGIEIQTAAKYNLPTIFVVMNNSALGNLKLRAHEYGNEYYDLVTLPTHDWANFAESLGVVGIKVTDIKDLKTAIKKALEIKKAVLLDVKTMNQVPPTEAFEKLFFGKRMNKATD